MARYWLYINGEVKGPYEVDQLIRIRGFSRQSMISVDDYSGSAGKWISPSEIPELAKIFQKADELHDAPTPAPRPAPKPKPKMPTRLTPVAPPVEEPKKSSWLWLGWILAALLIAGAAIHYVQTLQHKEKLEEHQLARDLVEAAPLPAGSAYTNIRHYLQSKRVSSHWDYERTPAGLYNVSLSLPPDAEGARPVYAFETNLQVQSVRGINTAAIKLLSEGFARPPAPKTAAAPVKPKKSPSDFFPSTINDRREAFEQGDFDRVWEMFSQRRRDEMAQGGITRTGFVRMQKLSYRMGTPAKQTILKTKQESESERLVLIKQTQPKHPDIFVKQRWVWENDAWRLDEEEKKIANAAAEPASDSSAAESSSATPAAPTPAKSIPKGLPGLSDPASH